MNSFPIDQIKSELLESIELFDFIIIKSSPGSGKTTRVPLFLREVFNRKIYILEPRRLAAKLASEFVAKSIGTKISDVVGYIFKYENKISPNTKIIFLTEGTFLQIIKDKNNLANTDVIILDEFHERHATTDMAFSFLLKLKTEYPHLKIIIMSATIESDKLENTLGTNVKTITLEQHRFPVEINYLDNNTLILKDSLEVKVLNSLSKCIQEQGHVLIFLPGMFEIRRCEELIKKHYSEEIIILHGDVAQFSIDDEFNNLENKKIILSTNIAESSVTIPGVRFVIDSGLHRQSKLNHMTRMSQLELKKISQSSAIQRAYRSNRESSGVVFRLYPKLDFEMRPNFDLPEIKRIDLSDLILKCFDLFKVSPSALTFVDGIDSNELNSSEEFLKKLAFLKDDQLTPLGIKLSSNPYPPRLLKIMSIAEKAPIEIFNHVIEILADWLEPNNKKRFKDKISEYFKPNGKNVSLEIEQIFLSGFSDQIAKLKNNEALELIHNNGEVYKISPRIRGEIDPHHDLWIILDVDNKNEVSKLMSIEYDWLFDLDYFPITDKKIFTFNHDHFQLFQEEINSIGAIVIERKRLKHFEINEDTQLFLKNVLLPDVLKFKDSFEFQRLYFIEKYSEYKIDDFDFAQWFLEKIIYFENQNKNWLNSLLPILQEDIVTFLNPSLPIELNRDLPLELSLHDKRKVKIAYDKTNGPTCESYIQDFYGLNEVPSILKGNLSLTISLIGPHKRSLQKTKDINSFWKKTYKEMLKELKREYPRHYWPENPENAEPILLLKNVPK